MFPKPLKMRFMAEIKIKNSSLVKILQIRHWSYLDWQGLKYGE